MYVWMDRGVDTAADVVTVRYNYDERVALDYADTPASAPVRGLTG